MKYKIHLNMGTWALIVFIITILAMVVRYSIMTDKFFWDSASLMAIEQSGYFYEGSFDKAAHFFHYINFFNIDTLFGWSVYISVIYFFINILILNHINMISVTQFILVLLSVLLWYLFAAGITKEIFQGLFFLVIYLMCIQSRFMKNNIVKILVGAFILLVSAILFRKYYIITAFFWIVIFVMFSLIRNTFLKRHNTLLISIFLSFIAILAFFTVAKIIYPSEYDIIVNLRSVQYAYLIGDTDSFIDNLLNVNSDNLLIYMVNYCINFFRLLFPVELLWGRKIYYLPFVIYQIAFSFFYLKNLKSLPNLTEKQVVNLTFITSFLIVSTMMEPDFGSWARHQSICWMFIIILFYENISETMECGK